MIDFEGSRQTAAPLAGTDQGTAQGGHGHGLPWEDHSGKARPETWAPHRGKSA